MRPRTRQQHKELAGAGLEFRRRKEKEKKTSLRQWKTDRRTERQEREEMGRHRCTERGSRGSHRQRDQRKAQIGKNKGDNGNKGSTQLHPWPLSLYLGLRLQGRKGTRTLVPGGREELGFSPSGAAPPSPHPGANQRLSSPR